MFIGGEPLNNQVLLWWNFVADNKEEITESHTRELNERRQRIADLCEQFKDDPAKLALLNAAAQELALIK